MILIPIDDLAESVDLGDDPAIDDVLPQDFADITDAAGQAGEAAEQAEAVSEDQSEAIVEDTIINEQLPGFPGTP